MSQQYQAGSAGERNVSQNYGMGVDPSTQRAGFDRNFKNQDSRYKNANLRVVNDHEGPIESPVPYSEEAEAAVIGALLIDRDCILKVIHMISKKDFFEEEYGMVYQTIAELYMEGTPTDVITLREKLRANNKLGEADGQVKASILLQLMRSTASPVHVQHYAKIVKEHSIRRSGLQRNTDSFSQYCDKSTRLENVLVQELEKLKRDIAWLRDSEANTRMLDHSQSLTYMERLEERGKFIKERQATLAAQLGLPSGRKPPRLRFGWAGFDGTKDDIIPQVLIQSSMFMMLNAKTSVGKTIFGENVAEANAAAGIDVLYVMTELNLKQMEDRRICRYSNLDYITLALEHEEGNMLQDVHWSELAKAMNTINSWEGREDFFYASGLTASEIVSEIQSRQSMLETTLNRRYRLVVIDYIGRVEPNKGFERSNEAERTKNIVKTFANFASSDEIAILCLSQVSREAAKNEEGLTQESGIGSSAIEQMSNLLLTLELNKNDDSQVFIKCHKYTFGPKDWSVPLVKNYPRYRFENLGDSRPAYHPKPAGSSPNNPDYRQPARDGGGKPAINYRKAETTATVPEDMGWNDVDNYTAFDPSARFVEPGTPDNAPPF